MFRYLGKSKIAFVLAILFGISLFFFKSGSRYSNFFNSDSVSCKRIWIRQYQQVNLIEQCK